MDTEYEPYMSLKQEQCNRHSIFSVLTLSVWEQEAHISHKILLKQSP